jgi:hypothetical protein
MTIVWHVESPLMKSGLNESRLRKSCAMLQRMKKEAYEWVQAEREQLARPILSWLNRPGYQMRVKIETSGEVWFTHNFHLFFAFPDTHCYTHTHRREPHKV